MVRLVIAEDDAATRRQLESTFRDAGYDLLIVEEGLSALAALQKSDAPIIAILDAMLPGMNGMEVCRKVRSGYHILPPYLILLTTKTDAGDATGVPDSSADDYITKPFDAGELRARVQVGVRVLYLQESLAFHMKELEETRERLKQLQGGFRRDMQTYEFGPFRLEVSERRLLRDGKPVPLTSRIFELLLLLVQRSGHLVGKEEIMREVWGGHIVEENNLTVTMSALRKALGQEPGQREYIETVPKCGYRFVADVTESLACEYSGKAYAVAPKFP
ncbi:MAG: response regulator transcription factor [Pyrinomonadaceae bacterium]|nr:response regulator transcription factor [Pyrinomonadaceae bacterium]